MPHSLYLTEPAQYFLKETAYKGTHPNYYNPDDFPWVKELEAHHSEIVEEIAGLIYGQEEMPPNLNPPYLSSPDAWRNFYFMNFRWYNHKNCIKFPKTFAFLKRIPNLSFAGITVLEPHSKVLPHIGETNAIIRCHFGLKVPGNYMECGIRVNGEDRGLQQGKLLMFSDAHYHTTWNNTNERRFIIVLDVIQPQFAHMGNWVCANSLAALTIKYIDERIKIINPLPNGVLQVMLKLFAVAWWCFLPLQKRFKWFYKMAH